MSRATRRANTLTHRTEQALRNRIAQGPLQAGAKLPTEKALAMEFGVSRTVVREAVAALRADGLLEARHGVGVFVAEQAWSGGQRDGGLQDRVPVLDIATLLDRLELRIAVETHAAGLAAARRSPSQESRIWEAMGLMRTAIDENGLTGEADYEFHRAICEATNNPAFLSFRDSIWGLAIPRLALKTTQERSLISHDYEERVFAEHLAICEAVSAGDAGAARGAMHAHLSQLQQRYRALVSRASICGGLPPDRA